MNKISVLSRSGMAAVSLWTAAALAQGVVPARPGPTTPVVGAPTPLPPATPGARPNAGPAGGDTGVTPAGTTPVGGLTERSLPDRAPPTIEGLEPEAGGLTASEVSRRATAVSTGLRTKRAQLRAADEKISQTMIQFFPKLTLQASYTRVSPVTSSFGASLAGAQSGTGPLMTGPCHDSAGNTTPGTCVIVGGPNGGNAPVGATAFTIPSVQDNYSVSGRLSIPLSDYLLRISDAAAASRASRDGARLSLEAERLKVDADARTLYFNWLRARGQASIARKSVEQTRARLEDAKAAFSVGAISKAELLRIQALVANTELVLTRSESMVSLTNGQLAIVMEDWHPNYHVGEGIPLPSTIPEETGSLNDLIAGAQARRLEVHAVDESVRAYRRGGDATRAGALPRVDAVGDITLANPNQRYFPPQQEWHTTWSAGVVASWTVGDTFLNSAAARELEDNAVAAEAQRTELKAGIAYECLTAYLDLARARAGLVQQRTALDAAEEAYRVTTDLFRAGRATGTDLIAAESGLLDAKLGEVNARIDLTVAAIALRHASGRDVPTARTEAKN